jgi:hypothetical protein
MGLLNLNLKKFINYNKDLESCRRENNYLKAEVKKLQSELEFLKRRKSNGKRIYHIESLSDLSKLTEEHFPSLSEQKVYKRLEQIFSKFELPVTVFVEPYYNDSDYKDIYYHFYASKYDTPPKCTCRLVLIEGSISENELFDPNFDLNKVLIGIISVRPIAGGILGKTYIDPKKIKKEHKIYVRTTPFKVGVIGRVLKIDAFPFSSQDEEYISCAETSLWMLLHYYGERYGVYRQALPHEIIEIVDQQHYQRVTPTTGLSYFQISRVLKEFGLSSKIYHRFIGEKTYYDDEYFKRIFHHYVESGIPLLVGIQLKKEKEKERGHAVVCIGHGPIQNKEIKELKPVVKTDNFQVFNSADFINSYIFMDDNKYPYEERKFDEFDYKEYESTRIKYFIVPLYKRVFIDACIAESTFYKILGNNLMGLSLSGISEKNLVIRIFLTTSRNYKASRFKSLRDGSYRFIEHLPMPKLVWVCEIFTFESYFRKKAIGEIIVDSTAHKRGGLLSILLIRYPRTISFRLPGEPVDVLLERIEKYRGLIKLQQEFQCFDKNLLGV